MNKLYISDNWNKEFTKKIEEKSINKEIIVFMTNFGQTTICKNAIESLKKIKLNNFIVFCTDEKAYTALHKIHDHCILLPFDIEVTEAGHFDSKCFGHMTFQKFPLVLKILSSGFNVLWSDNDVVFYKNPFKYFSNFNFEYQSGGTKNPRSSDSMWDDFIAPSLKCDISFEEFRCRFSESKLRDADKEVLAIESLGYSYQKLYELIPKKGSSLCSGFLHFRFSKFCFDLLYQAIDKQWSLAESATNDQEWMAASRDEPNLAKTLLSDNVFPAKVLEENCQPLNPFRFPFRFTTHTRRFTEKYQENAILHCNFFASIEEKVRSLKNEYNSWFIE